MISGARATTSSGATARFAACFLAAQFLEDVVAAGALDEFRDPTDAGDERLGPFLEVDVRSLVAVEVRRLQRALHLADEALGLVRAAYELAEVADRVVNFAEAARVHGPDVDAGLDEIGGELVLHVGGGDDEVGLQLEDGIEVAAAESAHFRLGLGTFGLMIEGGHTHDLLPYAKAMQYVRAIAAKGDQALGAGRGTTRHNRQG